MNYIKSIPPSIAEMTKLTRLNLKSNYLETLPVEIVNISSLKALEVENNPFSLFPAHLASNPIFPDLIAYLRALGANQVPWLKVKVMVVGKEAVGKTSLIRSILSVTPKRIRSDQNDVPLSTEGIDIEEWKPKRITKNQKLGKPLPCFQLWDLGGQSVFYPTHQFFMSRCAIYIVVFDVTQPDWDRVTYWVKQIRASTGKEQPPIIFVGTHVDLVLQSDLSEISSYLRKMFERQGKITGIHFVSCKNKATRTGVKELKTLLKEKALEIEMFSRTVPGSYVSLDEHLTKMCSEKGFRIFNFCLFFISHFF